MRTAEKALVRKHAAKLTVRAVADRLAEAARDRAMVVLEEVDGTVLRDEPPREFVVAIPASIPDPLIQSCKSGTAASLGLGETLHTASQFLRVLDDLAV